MRAVGVRRRAVMLTLALVSLALGPVIYAAAAPSGPAAAALPSLSGTITKVDLAHHTFVVKVSKGAAKYKGKAVTLNLKASPPGATSVSRLGHAGKLLGLKKNDRVVVTYKLNAANKPVAVHVTDSGPAPVSNPSPTPTSPTATAPTSAETTSPAGSPTTSASPSPTGPVTEVHATTTGGHVFLPATVNITVGTTIRLVIDDGVHTLTSGTYPTASGAFSLNNGQTFTFNSVGDYPFFCQYHGGSPYFMTGTVHVTAG